MQVDNQFQVFGDGMLVGTGDEWWTTYTYDFDPSTKVIGIEGENLVSKLMSMPYNLC